MAIIVVRLIVLAAATGAGLAFGPSLGLSNRNVWLGAAGLLAGALAVLLEWQARRVPVDRLFWGAVGGILGVAFGLGLGSALGAAQTLSIGTVPDVANNVSATLTTNPVE